MCESPIPVTQPLKDKTRAFLLEDWKTPKVLESDMTVLNRQLEMAHLEHGEAQRLYERSVLQPDMIRKMRLDKGNPHAQMLVAAYDAAHTPIVAGNPPLTRQASDAWTELFCFLRNQSGGPKAEVPETLKDDFARTLTANWATYPPEKQKAFAGMSQYWPSLRLAWAKGKDADRQKIIATWQPVVNPGQSGDQQQVAAQDAAARSNAFVKRDANTVSEQELLEAAKDADIAGLNSRRAGGPQDLANAAIWEERARLMRAGKAAYVRNQANERDKQAIIDEYYKTQIILNALNRRLPIVR